MNIIEAIKDRNLFGALPEFKNLSTWTAWLVCLKAIFALKMTPEEVEIFRKFTGRVNPPNEPFKEIFLLVGRRGGKSLVAAITCVFLAIFVDWHLGLESGHIMTIAVDREQAQAVFDYIRKILKTPAFEGMVMPGPADQLRLKNNVIISVQTCSYRTLRGFKILAAVCDEIGFYSVEGQNPATEILTGLRPSLGGQLGSKLLCISTGFQKSGPLWEAFRDKYARDDPHTLVWAAGTRDMNPTYPEVSIQEELKVDPVAAPVEYGIGNFFRDNLETYLSSEALAACVVPGRFELRPRPDIQYVAGVDPSGGSPGGDAMTLSIVHREEDRVVQDVLRIKQPGPNGFNPAECVKEFASILRSFDVHEVTGDRYSGEWCSSQFEKEGITYRAAKRTKSDYYLEFLPIVMQGGCELLDHEQQSREFLELQRRPCKVKDTIDHAPNLHDDLANAAAVSIVEASNPYIRDDIVFPDSEPPTSSEEDLEREFIDWLSGNNSKKQTDKKTDAKKEYEDSLREAKEELDKEIYGKEGNNSKAWIKRGW